MFRNYLSVCSLALMVAFVFSSCKKEDQAAPIVTPEAVEFNVTLAEDPVLGKLLTDDAGKTLYYFSLDHDGESVFCIDNCLDAWPVFYRENIAVGDGLIASDFATITRGDGTKQTTYKGWPLYYFANDLSQGETNGEGVNDVWFVAKPDYSIMIVLAQLVGKDVNGVETALTSAYEAGMEQTFYFTDGAGNTLYRFFADSTGQNNYTASDFSNNDLWPVYEVDLGAIPSTLDRSDFATVDVFGKTQITYKGWPLYQFQQDEQRGDNYGVGFPQPGIWPIANAGIEATIQ